MAKFQRLLTRYFRAFSRVDELPTVVAQFALPPGSTNPDELFDVDIEADIWDEHALRLFRQAGTN